MSVKVTVAHGDKGAIIEIGKPNNGQILEIIRGVFGVFGSVTPTYEIVPKINFPKPSDLHNARPTQSNESEKSSVTSQANEMGSNGESEQASKQLPYINGARTLSTTLGEKLGPLLGLSQADKVESHSSIQEATGDNQDSKNTTLDNDDMKIISGLEHYRTRVYCKNAACGKQSNRWIPQRQKSVQCPHCKTVHVRRDAVPQGFPNQDQFGNYFKADSLWINHYKTQQERAKSPIH